MKVLFKNIFSRFSIIAFMVILQVFVIYAFFFLLDEKYYPAQIVASVISWLFLISLSFRKMPQESKVTWAILILGFVPLGAILYIMFSKNFTSLRQKRIIRKLEVRTNMYNIKDDAYDEEMKSILPLKYFQQMEYIYKVNKQYGFNNVDTMFFPNGESYFDQLKKDLKEAKKFIFLEFFIISKGKMLEEILDILETKIKEGVEVRLIIDDIGCMKNLPLWYTRKIRKIGIKLVVFNRFVPIVSAVHNNRDHRKIVIIDGKIAYTGGINIADEYINEIHPYGYWKDSGIRLVGRCVDEFTMMFLTNYDLQIRKVDTNIHRYLELENFSTLKANGVVLPYGDGPRPAYQEYVGENVYLNMINSAERYIYITTPYLIIDSKIENALINASLKGVDVRIVTPGIPDKKMIYLITRSTYFNLQKYGVKIYEYKPGFIHAKQVLCDDDVGIIGTINFDYRSLLHHYENAVWMYKTDALVSLKKDFDDIFNNANSMEKYHQNIFVYILCKALKIFQPLL